MKLRLRYAKRGKLRFTSHRDVARAFERALRRAGVPMAYSQGYSPHPKVSWVGAAPTGAASEAEYVEIQLARWTDPEVVRAELDAALPDGLAVLEGVPAGPGRLAERIEASRWQIEIPAVDAGQLRNAATALLATPQVLVERVTKDGRRCLDARAAIVSLAVQEPPTRAPGAGHLPGCGILFAVVRQVSPAVRPDDVLSALGVVAGLQPSAPVRATRTAQGRLDDDGGLTDPLAPDRASARKASVGIGCGGPDQHGVAGHAS
ncbi:MAG TPA: TIGR03936 family radical SAM-associated protein [Pseudonocardiaceae bacterium]|nr:TIGR03936 family radical SAM-associated protein [Pseudonocardiaceae bacterium]